MIYRGLKAFEVENYKSIKSSGNIDINGISVILGANSSGKTNLLESLLLLKQSIDERSLNLTLNGSQIKLGEYGDIIHNHDVNHSVIFRFHFEREETDEEDDRPFSCPICGKNYKESGWYTRHIKNKHEEFWDYTSGQISDFETHSSLTPSLELSFAYDEDSKSNHLEYVKFENPEEAGALYLSTLKLVFGDDYAYLEATDIHENPIIEFEFDRTELTERMALSSYRQLTPLISELLTRHLGSDRRGYPRYSKNQPYVADQIIPTAFDHKEALDEVFKGYRKQGQDDAEFTEIGQELENLARGLITRLGSVSDNAMRMIDTLDLFLENLSHIGPLRRNPQRIYFGSGGPPQEPYSQGVNIEERIFRDSQSDTYPIIEKTNEWLNETGFDCEIDIEPLGVGDIYQIVVIEDGLKVNLADSGFGLSQALPIIVECVNMGMQQGAVRYQRGRPPRPHRIPRQYLTVIEEPEIHLNPRIESAMADFFIELEGPDTGFILETHSEHILNRIQRRIADGSIEDPNSVSVFFIEKDGIESDIREIEIDESGKIEDWPSGFFQEDFEDAVEMLKESFVEGG
jgi:predicted ATPase/uncharacterized C2H2 Zn-finger protein